MSICEFPGCEGDLDAFLSFKCNYCGGSFCSNHRLPSMHSCSGIDAWKSRPPPSKAMVRRSERGLTEPPLIRTPKRYYTKREGGWVKKAIIILFILGLIGGSLYLGFPYIKENSSHYSIPTLVTQTQVPLPMPIHTTTPTPTQTPTPTSTSKEHSLEELRTYALELINEDRAKYGLKPVELGDNTAAQVHAEDMLSNRFLSHWGTDGSKPYMRYTKHGGRGAVSENAGFSGFYYYEPNAATIDSKSDLQELEHDMMYDDAESYWGHRDNILDKWHNKVNIGIAYDSMHLAYVQDFEEDYINWSKPISYHGILNMEGTTSIGSIDMVTLYYDPKPQALNQSQLLHDPEYTGSYGLGQEIGYILESGYYVEGTKYVEASVWQVSSSGHFLISANIEPLLYKGGGVYTVVIWADVDGEMVPLTSHSLFVD